VLFQQSFSLYGPKLGTSLQHSAPPEQPDKNLPELAAGAAASSLLPATVHDSDKSISVKN